MEESTIARISHIAARKILLSYNDLIASGRASKKATILIASIDPTLETIVAKESINDLLVSDVTPKLLQHLSADKPSYIFLAIPSTTSSNGASTDSHTEYAITFNPDQAPVRQKTLFASTRLSLLRDIGKERFRDSATVSDLGDLKELLKQYLNLDSAETSGEGITKPAPLTKEEKLLADLKEAELHTRGGMGGRKLESGGKLSVKIDDKAMREMARLNSEPTLLVQMHIDLSSETITHSSSSTSVTNLASEIPASQPRYSLYRHQKSLLFIYSCPAGLKVKERMLYASSKAGFLASIPEDLHITRKIEVSELDELADHLLEETQSDSAQTASAEKVTASSFARPKRPGRK